MAVRRQCLVAIARTVYNVNGETSDDEEESFSSQSATYIFDPCARGMARLFEVRAQEVFRFVRLVP